MVILHIRLAIILYTIFHVRLHNRLIYSILIVNLCEKCFIFAANNFVRKFKMFKNMEALLNHQIHEPQGYKTPVVQKGHGFAPSHHGEIIQGLFFDRATNDYVHGLLTVPCNYFWASASFSPSKDRKIYYQNSKKKASFAVNKTLEYINKQEFGGLLELTSNIPVGFGCGSSTADVVATIKAVSNAFAINLSEEEIGRLAVEIETASDPIMYRNPMILFAQRKGIVLRRFESKIPDFDILGFSTSGQGVDTLALEPINYTNYEIQEFENMVDLVNVAALTKDPKYLGIAAYKSALICQKYRPKPFYDVFANIVEDGMALGCQVSHSGTVVGFIFNAHETIDPQNARVSKVLKIINQLGIKDIWRFTVSQ